MSAGAEEPVSRALAQAYNMAGPAGTDETLKRLLIPALATWDPAAGKQARLGAGLRCARPFLTTIPI